METSGIPSGLVLELVLFNVITGDMDSGIECTFSQVADKTELCGVLHTEGMGCHQRDLDSLKACGTVQTL